MDTQAIVGADDNTLKELGIDTVGDIVALKVFCKRKCRPDKVHENKMDERQVKKKQLISLLTAGGAANGPNIRPKKKLYNKERAQDYSNKNRRFELGWLHKFSDSAEYTNIRAKEGGGTRVIEMPGNSNKDDIISFGKKLFFPNRSSPVACESDLFFSLGNYKQEKVQPSVTFPDGTVQPLTLYNYSKSTRLSKTRLYIMSRKILDEMTMMMMR